mmetsp:Transcript_17791/g.49128  ORF Transcript_17791/g.49128 Transcript_17791/m.49128 type:complete len:326 (-) Transcript_17791:1381-2358(-)
MHTGLCQRLRIGQRRRYIATAAAELGEEGGGAQHGRAAGHNDGALGSHEGARERRRQCCSSARGRVTEQCHGQRWQGCRSRLSERRRLGRRSLDALGLRNEPTAHLGCGLLDATVQLHRSEAEAMDVHVVIPQLLLHPRVVGLLASVLQHERHGHVLVEQVAQHDPREKALTVRGVANAATLGVGQRNEAVHRSRQSSAPVQAAGGSAHVQFSCDLPRDLTAAERRRQDEAQTLGAEALPTARGGPGIKGHGSEQPGLLRCPVVTCLQLEGQPVPLPQPQGRWVSHGAVQSPLAPDGHLRMASGLTNGALTRGHADDVLEELFSK